MDTSSPSVALIRLLREITRLGKALDKVTYRKQCHFDQEQGETWIGGWRVGGKDVRNSSLCTLFFTVMLVIVYIMTRKALLLKSVYICQHAS